MNRSLTSESEIVPLNVAVVGHVDHGKSTLVGRLLHDTGMLAEGKLEQLEAMCRRRGMSFEWAFVTDALQPERDQGVTIDVSYIRFRSRKRPYLLIDAPGHREFLKNMVTGAANADGAVLVIDAAEGVREQTRRHGYIVHLMGLDQVTVAVTKMDLVGYAVDRFDAIETDVRAYLGELGITPCAVIPVCGQTGENIASRAASMAWYNGDILTEALDRLPAPAGLDELPLRLMVQDVYRFDRRRIIAGRVETGRLSVGETLLFSPSNLTATVSTIEGWNQAASRTEGRAGEAVGITLEDQIFVERGELVSRATDAPIETNVFRARMFWLGRKPLVAGARYMLKLMTCETPVVVQAIERVINTVDFTTTDANRVERNEIAEVILRSRAMLALDPFVDNPRTGRFALVDGYEMAGGGIISMEGYPDQRALVTVKSTNVGTVEHRVTGDMRVGRNHHLGGVLWFTGLSGAGKSTLAIEVERRLFGDGYQIYVLDGDNIRRGLNANLGFSPEDRAENIRRVGEVAALFADAGFIVISAFISPYRNDRERARRAAGERFHEVHIEAALEVCEKRDPKGLYRRARAGEIEDFTGISAPYEAPVNPELVVDTSHATVEESVESIVIYIKQEFELASG